MGLGQLPRRSAEDVFKDCIYIDRIAGFEALDIMVICTKVWTLAFCFAVCFAWL